MALKPTVVRMIAPIKGTSTKRVRASSWQAAPSAAFTTLYRYRFQIKGLRWLLSLLLFSSLTVSAKNTGCFDNKRFCFELTPSSSSLYLVSVQRKVELPVALTLYSNVMQEIPTGKDELKSKAHVNAFLDTNNQVPLGVVKNANAFWQSMRVKWTVGRVGAIHDNDYPYTSPLQPADEYRIVQGFNGNFSHSGASRYALDFAAPVGTPILAARGGIVIDTKDDGTKGGPTPEFAKYANYVVILHSDGTTGEYYHLRHEGVAVTRGQSVQKGQLIGYTGNTGFSSLPHLHFGVYVAKFHGKYTSVPFSLTNASTETAH